MACVSRGPYFARAPSAGDMATFAALRCILFACRVGRRNWWIIAAGGSTDSSATPRSPARQLSLVANLRVAIMASGRAAKPLASRCQRTSRTRSQPSRRRHEQSRGAHRYRCRRQRLPPTHSWTQLSRNLLSARCHQGGHDNDHYNRRYGSIFRSPDPLYRSGRLDRPIDIMAERPSASNHERAR